MHGRLYIANVCKYPISEGELGVGGVDGIATDWKKAESLIGILND